MHVTVKVFAHLRERLGFEQQWIEIAEPGEVRAVWTQLTGEPELPGHVLCAVNLEYARAEDAVQDGDEVAFFPPVTGG